MNYDEWAKMYGIKTVWISHPIFGGGVDICEDDGCIVREPPMLRKFHSKPLGDLLRWLKGCKWEIIETEEDHEKVDG